MHTLVSTYVGNRVCLALLLRYLLDLNTKTEHMKQSTLTVLTYLYLLELAKKRIKKII